VSAVEGDCI